VNSKLNGKLIMKITTNIYGVFFKGNNGKWSKNPVYEELVNDREIASSSGLEETASPRKHRIAYNKASARNLHKKTKLMRMVWEEV
jgi:hypothetical protein